MIYIKLSGGIGNQMFQFAAAYRLATQKKTKVSLILSDYYNLNSNITPRSFELNKIVPKEYFEIATKTTIELFEKNPKKIIDKIKLRLKRMTFYYERKIYQSSFENLSKEVYLEGYFQDLNYFGAFEKIILEAFTLNRNLNQKTVIVAEQICTETFPVAIHIRRGDYITDHKTNSVHGVCDISYYHGAIDKLIENGVSSLYIFSDEPDWAKKNIKTTLKTTYVDWNTASDAYQDIYLMSLCRGFVIANSTFSWWGAMLSQHKEKVMIAPNRWFSANDKVTPPIFDSRWILL